MRFFRTRGLSVGAATLLGLALFAPATASVSAPVPEPAPSAQSKNWRVEPVADGYRVTLRLAERVPVRAALPLLAVDGRPVGVARQAADQRTLSVVSKDPRVLTAREVTLVWPGDVKPAGSPRSGDAGTDADWLKASRGAVSAVDPGASGAYQVDTAQYDLGDEAVYLPGLLQRSELRGEVWSPRGASGPRPVVVFLHGRHAYCYGREPAQWPAKPWPCPAGMKPIPSYRGYDAPARALASHGYHVVSISANAVNAFDFDSIDAGALARGQLVLSHLDLWKRWSTTGGGPFGNRFVGRLDFANIGLMGHSRGGEGVVRAAVLNSQRGGRYGIRAVLPLAPTDFARHSLPGTAMSVLLPYCDGDVNDLQGQLLYDDSRYAQPGDRAPRSTLLVMGTNHNYFNTEWTPGQSVADSTDDWGGDPKATCGTQTAARLTAKEQQAVGRAYIAGFFRLQLGREAALLPLFDGSNTRAASAGRAVVRVVAQAPADQRRDLTRFDRPLPAGAVTGKATAQVCAGIDVGGPKVKGPYPVCLKAEQSARLPHWGEAAFVHAPPTTVVTKLRWTGKSGVVRVNLLPEQRDVRSFWALTFRAAPDPSGAARTDLSVRVVDGRGRAHVVPVSAVSDALVRLPGGPRESSVPKTMLRTVRIPVASLRSLDLSDLRTVELRTDRVAAGSVFVSDLSFSVPGIGRSAPLLLPSLSASNIKLAEGSSGNRNADFWITMSRRSPLPVTFYAEVNSDFNSGTVPSIRRRVVLAPGQTRAKVSVPFKGNTRDGYDLIFALVLSLPQRAILGNSFGAGLVTDDDPTPTVSIGNAVAVEGTRMIKFPLRLSAPSDKWVNVSGRLANGTAVLRRDFVTEWDPGAPEPPEYRVLGIFDRGATRSTISVILLDDRVREPTEKFTISVTELDGATLTGPRKVTGTIRDDD